MSEIAAQAVRAVSDPRFEARPGWCQRWARQVVEAVAGGRFAAMMQGTARDSGLAARRLGWAVAGPPRPGDLLYKLGAAGGYGHVGIVVEDGRVAENSSTAVGRVRGAVGYRTLAAYGRYDVIVRLPLQTAAERAVAAAWPAARAHLRGLYAVAGGLPEPARGALLAALNGLRRAWTEAGAPGE